VNPPVPQANHNKRPTRRSHSKRLSDRQARNRRCHQATVEARLNWSKSAEEEKGPQGLPTPNFAGNQEEPRAWDPQAECKDPTSSQIWPFEDKLEELP